MTEVRQEGPGVVVADVTGATLDGADLVRTLQSRGAGALVVFEGRVRDHNDGRSVVGLHYDAYEEMAGQVLADIAGEAVDRSGVASVAVRHRTGSLVPGEVSLVVGVLAPHRDQAFDAARYVVEELKRRAPIWKKEEYGDGTSIWLDGRPAGSGPAERGDSG